MSSRWNLPRACLLGFLASAGTGHAADLVWDSGNTGNGSTINPANGTWNTTSTNRVWNTGSGNVAWSAANSAIFAGADGTYAVTVGTAVSAEDAWFQNSGYTLSASAAQTVSFTRTSGSTEPQLRVSSGKTLVIGNNVTVRNGVSTGLIAGENGTTAGGTITIASGGVLKQNSSNTGGIDGSGTILNILTGGLWSGPDNSGASGSLVIGISAGSNATARVNGGSIDFGSGRQPLNVGSGGAGNLELNSGTVSINAASTAGLQLAAGAAGSGTVHLNGGTLETPLVRKGAGTSAIFNFNGGKLLANASGTGFMTGLSRANVRNGGAVIDTAGFDIAIQQPLLHSDLAGDAATDGGLLKSGSGTLTLAGENTYTGGTNVSAGTLALSGSLASPVSISANGTLTAGPSIVPLTIHSSLSLAGTIRLKIHKGGGPGNDVVTGLTSVTYGGTLALDLTGGEFAAGDVFQLFEAASYSGAFSQIAVIPAPVNGLYVDASQLAVDGTLRVVTDTRPPSFTGPLEATATELLEGQAVTLSAPVTGGWPISYQWLFNGVPIPGPTTAAHTIATARPGDTGDYTVTITNPYGTTTSTVPVLLKVAGMQMDVATTADGFMELAHDTMPFQHYQVFATENLGTWSAATPVFLGNGSRALHELPMDGKPSQFATFSVAASSIETTRFPAEPWKDTRWIDPGGWVTLDVTTLGLPANTPSLDAAAMIAQILSSTSGKRRLYFPAGTYYFNTNLTISTSNLWIDGDGRDQTIFRIVAPGSTNAEIRFAGSTRSPISVSVPPKPGDKQLTLSDAGSIAVGDIIQLYADHAPLTNTGQAWSLQIYSQIFRVMAKYGNTLILDMKVLLDYPASYAPVTREITVIRNIKVSAIGIDRVNEPVAQDVSNLEFACADNCWVTGIESNYSGRTHVGFENSKDCLMTGNFVHDCWKHTTGGYGYGYNLVATTGCRITNNKAQRLRHPIIVSIGANHNVISYNSVEQNHDYNDVALHAVHAYMNLFEGNMFEEGYADTSKDGWADIEATTGPGNTWFRNFATGKVGSAQSGTRRQTIIGNCLSQVLTTGADHYVGANRVGTTVSWGAFNSTTLFPASLYLMTRPEFLEANTPWPVFGPGLPNFGSGNQLPARLGVPED
ncbi:autotransporter-associated beta strand repeat-containing protein [Luteolibacter arcticus]|uniref:autotransporter-associated beta strand repeat-containing protein n=1 Tax=Luteolibacter arcticus TaxID=1581411 RepID=UPI0029CAC56F|nr:autotransporter-associated beta strand repeat-containing protein [Luteolibacter arcticus]